MTEAKWNRRKEARPTEIIDAATEVFIETGYASANLDNIASRAGIAKGTLYRYFENKESLFRGVVQHAIGQNLALLDAASAPNAAALSDIVPRLLQVAEATLSNGRAPALARLVIAESQTFPDLATIWHDNVVSKVLSLLTAIIVRAQKSGEVREGDPLCHAFSIVGPFVAAALFRQVFGASSPYSPDLERLAKDHSVTVLRGLTKP